MNAEEESWTALTSKEGADLVELGTQTDGPEVLVVSRWFLELFGKHHSKPCLLALKVDIWGQ